MTFINKLYKKLIKQLDFKSENIISSKNVSDSISDNKSSYNLSDMWNILGIENTINDSIQINRIDFPKVMTKNGMVYAKDAMTKAGFAVDNVLPAGGQFYGGSGINIRQINSLGLDNVFLGWGELSLLQQNCIVNNICSIFSESLTEKWIKFVSKNENKSDKIEELEKSIKHFKLKEKFNKMIYNTILLGTCYLTPKFKDDEDDLQNELILDNIKIKKDSLEDFYIIEPTWVVPIDFNMVNPRSNNFYKPLFYNIFGTKIHHSRIEKFIYIEPVNLIAPIYLFGGIPLIQQVLPYILDFLNTKKEVVKIISRFNISIFKTDMTALSKGDNYGKCKVNASDVKGRIQAFNAIRNNFGTFLMDKEEEFTQIQIPLTGIEDILQQQAEFLCFFLRLTVSKFFGQAPRGLNATGEFDANQYVELIRSIQESKIRPCLTKMIKIIMLNLWGSIDEEIDFEFLPIGEINESLQSTLKNDKINRAKTLVDAGMADPQKMMESLMKDPTLELENYNYDAEDYKIEIDLENNYEKDTE